jgi:hypothetical protein
MHGLHAPAIGSRFGMRLSGAFSGKWLRVSVQKRSKTKNLEHFHDSINLGNALAEYWRFEGYGATKSCDNSLSN